MSRIEFREWPGGTHRPSEQWNIPSWKFWDFVLLMIKKSNFFPWNSIMSITSPRSRYPTRRKVSDFNTRNSTRFGYNIFRWKILIMYWDKVLKIMKNVTFLLDTSPCRRLIAEENILLKLKYAKKHSKFQIPGFEQEISYGLLRMTGEWIPKWLSLIFAAAFCFKNILKSKLLFFLILY